MKSPRAINEIGPHHGGACEAIPSGQLWPLDFLHARCGYGSRARALAIKAGLPVYTWQKRRWIFTDDLIAFLKREGAKGEQDDGEQHDDAAECLLDPKFSGNGCEGTAKT